MAEIYKKKYNPDIIAGPVWAGITKIDLQEIPRLPGYIDR
jgi:hypothetical protein